MVTCGNCEYVYDKTTKNYTANWRGSLGPNDKDYSKFKGLVGIGVSNNYIHACRAAANDICRKRYKGKDCDVLPPMPCDPYRSGKNDNDDKDKSKDNNDNKNDITPPSDPINDFVNKIAADFETTPENVKLFGGAGIAILALVLILKIR